MVAGAVGGYGDGTYGPERAVLRGHMATFLVGSFEHLTGESMPEPTEDWFADVDGSSVERTVNQVAHVGWAGGYGEGVYGHRDPVRRDHMAYFVTRWLDSAVTDAGAALPG